MAAVLMTKTLSATDIPWEHNSVWVQDHGMVRTEGLAGANGTIALRYQDGARTEMPLAAFRRQYGETIRSNVFKPLRNPIRAWTASEDCSIELDGLEIALAEGDVVLRNRTGQIETICATRFLARFRAIPLSDLPEDL